MSLWVLGHILMQACGWFVSSGHLKSVHGDAIYMYATRFPCAWILSIPNKIHACLPAPVLSFWLHVFYSSTFPSFCQLCRGRFLSPILSPNSDWKKQPETDETLLVVQNAGSCSKGRFASCIHLIYPPFRLLSPLGSSYLFSIMYFFFLKCLTINPFPSLWV